MISNAVSKHEKLETVRAFVHSYRLRHDIKVGTPHHGDDNLSAVGEMLFGALPHTADGDGAWQELETDQAVLDQIYDRVLICAANC